MLSRESDVVSICAPTICPFPGLMPFFLAGSARSLAFRTDGRRAASRRLPVWVHAAPSLARAAGAVRIGGATTGNGRRSGAPFRIRQTGDHGDQNNDGAGSLLRPAHSDAEASSRWRTPGRRGRAMHRGPTGRVQGRCAREKKTMDCNAYRTRGRVLAPCVRARWPWADRGGRPVTRGN